MYCATYYYFTATAKFRVQESGNEFVFLHAKCNFFFVLDRRDRVIGQALERPGAMGAIATELQAW